MTESLNAKIVKASKWSAITELLSRLVSPVSTIVLARLLTPEAFGILVTATMVISFAEIFTDAGFQKYLIQHHFENEREEFESTTVAFWSNLSLSVVIFLIICAFSKKIAAIVGCPDCSWVIVASSICIPIEAFSSIQMALYKRHFDFKTLFYVRMVGVLIPVFFTIPVAYITHSYWALILGMILLNVSNAIILTAKSSWKPNFFFSIKRLKKMFSFSIWTVIEALSIWLTTYLDVFIVGSILSQYYLGLYKTSMNLVAQMTNIIVSMTVPVLFSALSRLQDQPQEFQQCLFRFQKVAGILLIPISVGIFLFKDVVVAIFLGDQWQEASFFVGIWGLTTGLVILFSHFSSEVYRAKGTPKVSFCSQVLHLVVLIPSVLFFSGYGFDVLCEIRSLVRLEGVLVNFILIYAVVKISPFQMIKNLFPSFFSSTVMFVVIYALLSICESDYLKYVLILVAVFVYFAVLFLFNKERNMVLNLIHRKKRREGFSI